MEKYDLLQSSNINIRLTSVLVALYTILAKIQTSELQHKINS